MSDTKAENNRKYQALISASTTARIAYESKLASYSTTPMGVYLKFAELDPLSNAMTLTWNIAHGVIKAEYHTFIPDASEETIRMFNEESAAQMNRLRKQQNFQPTIFGR
jgi:hypothetical protein